jgi:uncharacterized membrane protein
MKLYSKKEIFPILLILAIFAVGLYFWPQLPDRVPSHWNAYGQIDGWSSKTFAILFFPALIAGLYLLLSFVPLMDPLKINIELFSHFYFWFKTVFILFFGAVFFLTIYAGLGHALDIGRFILPGIAILFFFLGLFMPKIRKNYTIGIRLPWTLHSEIVWDKTHKLGGKLFIALAIIIVLSSFLPAPYPYSVLISGIIVLLAILIWYSYREWKKIEKNW